MMYEPKRNKLNACSYDQASYNDIYSNVTAPYVLAHHNLGIRTNSDQVSATASGLMHSTARLIFTAFFDIDFDFDHR